MASAMARLKVPGCSSRRASVFTKLEMPSAAIIRAREPVSNSGALFPKSVSDVLALPGGVYVGVSECDSVLCRF